MTEQELRRTAIVIQPRGRAVLCVWAAVPGLLLAPFVFWQSLWAGGVFCAVWAALASCAGKGPAATLMLQKPSSAASSASRALAATAAACCHCCIKAWGRYGSTDCSASPLLIATT